MHPEGFSVSETNGKTPPGNCVVRVLLTKKKRLRAGRRHTAPVRQDAPNLKPLPAEPWVHVDWKRCRVGLDYHIAIEGHSLLGAPHRSARSKPGSRYARRKSSWVASASLRIYAAAVMDAIPPSPSTCLPAIVSTFEWTPSKIREEANRIGPMLSLLVENIIEAKPIRSRAGYCSCLGIIDCEGSSPFIPG